MLISQIFAWVSVFLCLMEAFKFIARKSKLKSLNKFFRKIHVPFGEVLIVCAALHGLLAGNVPETAMKDMMWGSVLFTFNWGTMAFVCIILLALTYMLRKKLKKKWMLFHRALTVVVLVVLALHLFEVGINVQSHFNKPEQLEATTEITTESTTTQVVTQATTKSIETTTTTTKPSVRFSGAVLKDGTYEGSAVGRNGRLTLSVTVEDGEVSAVEITEQSETPRYFKSALTIVESIISKQSLKVDVISGATITSDAIKEAVNNALENAVIEGELEK